MNRRRFLALLGAALPVAAGGMWWWGRRRESLRVANAPGAGGAIEAAPVTSSGAATTAPAASGSWTMRYGPGLPLRWADPETSRGPVAQALATARKHILAHCTNLSESNLAIHGVRALGGDLPLSTGRTTPRLGGDAYRVLLQSYTREFAFGGRLWLEVPVHDEGHGHAMLKTLVERQCDPDVEFIHDGRTYRFRDFVESARMLSAYPAPGPVDDHSWTLMALARVTPPGAARWTNARGQSFDLDRLLDDTSAALEADTRLVREVDLGAAELPRDCAAFTRACGGLHMLYALAAALSSGHGSAQRNAAFAAHMRTQIRRFTYDLGVIDQVEKLNAARGNPNGAAVAALDQRIKFLGHSLEVVGLVDQFHLYEFSPAERRTIDAGRERLCAEIVANASRDYGRAKGHRELYESLVSGLCHAYNGLRMSPG